jgi:hypothetical protein
MAILCWAAKNSLGGTVSQDPVISCISFLAGYRIFVFLSTVNEVVRSRLMHDVRLE